jgi:glycosyltransferase involved in cell wall biosynthesis
MRWVRPEDWGKTHIVHCGLDLEYLRGDSIEISEYPRLLCVARLSEQKGHLVLLQAAAMLRDSGVRFTLLLVGDGSLRGVLEAKIDELRLADCVRVAGWMTQKEVQEQIRLSRATVLPSFAEGLPVAIMESMALRRPVISTYIAGIPELVNFQNGWLVPAGDAEALCAAMRAAIESDVATLSEMGDAARRQAVKRHDIAVTAALMEQHIKSYASRCCPDSGKLARGQEPTETVAQEVAQNVRRRVARSPLQGALDTKRQVTGNP